MRMFLTAAACFIAFAAFAAPAPPDVSSRGGPASPLVTAIHDARTGEALSSDTLAERIAAADFVLLGERHDNPDHHALQAWAVAVAAQSASEGRLVLEMVRRGDDGPLATATRDSVDTLGDALGWDARGWPDYAMYAPILAAALRGGWTLHAGDAPADAMLTAVRGGEGAPGADERARLGLSKAFPAPLAARMERAVVDGHCGLLPDEMVPGLVSAQRLRDATLADALLDGESPAVLIAGSGHIGSEAVPFCLAERAPQRETLAIAFVEAPAGVDDPAALVEGFGTAGAVYDVVWVTDALDRGDVCAELRERFGGG